MNKLILLLSPALIFLTGCSKKEEKEEVKAEVEETAKDETFDKDEAADDDALELYYKTKKDSIMKSVASRADQLVALGKLLADYENGQRAIQAEATHRREIAEAAAAKAKSKTPQKPIKA